MTFSDQAGSERKLQEGSMTQGNIHDYLFHTLREGLRSSSRRPRSASTPAMRSPLCVTVVHSNALPAHGALGKFHVATLWRRRVVARCNRWVCNLTPGRAFATALPTKSLFKKERDESGAPDSVTPHPKGTQLSLRPRVPRTWIGINEWNTGEYRQPTAQENSLSNLPATRNLCRAWQAHQHEFYPLELGLGLVKCVKRRPASSAPLTKESRCD